jgi:hypothetical protein
MQKSKRTSCYVTKGTTYCSIEKSEAQEREKRESI